MEEWEKDEAGGTGDIGVSVRGQTTGKGVGGDGVNYRGRCG